MERVLVTGGAGYIGSLVAPMLLQAGHHVTIFDTFTYGAGPILGFSAHPRIEIVKGDVRERSAVAAAVARHDWILHLAAIVGYPACAADEALAISTNVDGTANVVAAMGRTQRLIFASTGSTYGKVDGTCTEDSPTAPLSLYGRTKRDAERLVQDSGAPHAILRFATVYGSSPRMRLDLLVNDFVYQAIHHKQIVLYEGHYRRTFLHSSDAAAVYPFAMANWEKMAGMVFNVGDESMSFTKRDVALRIREYVSFYLHEADVGTDADQRDYFVDYGRIKSAGYKATVTLDEGIRELVKILSVFTQHDPHRNT